MINELNKLMIDNVAGGVSSCACSCLISNNWLPLSDAPDIEECTDACVEHSMLIHADLQGSTCIPNVIDNTKINYAPRKEIRFIGQAS